MFEHDGTTPAQQDSTTPEPTNDQLIGMVSTAETQVEILTNTLKGHVEIIAELDAKTAELEREKNKWLDRYLSAKDLIQESIDNGEWSEDELAEPFWEKLADILNLNIATEREITVTVTWNLRVKTAKQFLSDWDFDISIDSDSGELDIISGESCPDIDISE